MPFFLSIRDAIKEQPLIFAVIIIAIIFNITTIRSGHQWEGDFALYTAHARNLANNHDFADTGYIFNPDRPYLAPRSYPPVFPAFLAPVNKIFGLDLYAMKIANILAFTLFLLIFQHYVRKRLRSSVSQIAVVAAVAFSPWFWDAKDSILPDFLFILLIYSAVVLMDSTYTSGKTRTHRYLLAIFTGFIVYMAYGSRSIGIVLVPALLLSDVVRLRSIRKLTIVIIAVFSALYIFQNATLQTDQSYINTLKGTLNSKTDTNHTARDNQKPPSLEAKPLLQKFGKILSSNAEYYHQAMSAYWNSYVNTTLDNFIYAAMGLLAVIGFISLALRSPSSGDSLLIVYVCLLLLVPFRQSRYLLPLIPLYLVYIFHGMETIHSKWPFFKRHIAHNSSVFGLLLIITLSYVGTFSKMNFNDLANGVHKSESLELFEFIRQHTAENSVLISSKPRLLALFTHRSSSVYAWRGSSAEKLLNYFDSINATHIVLAKESSGIKEKKEYATWVKNNSENFELVFENPDFQIYQIQ